MKSEIDKLLKDIPSIRKGSDAIHYTFLDTPFATVTNLIGGIPRARFTTLAGPEHTGKGTFCAQLVAHHQAKDPNFVVLWTDAENAFDENWAKNLGIDLDRIYIQKYTNEVNTMEKLLDQSLAFIKELKVDLWIVDSIGALVPKNDVYESKGKTLVDKSLESTNMLNLQRKLGEFYRKANIYISPRPSDDYLGCAVLMLGQVNCKLSLAA
jgi:RecA/RadA recombinase